MRSAACLRESSVFSISVLSTEMVEAMTTKRCAKVAGNIFPLSSLNPSFVRIGTKQQNRQSQRSWERTTTRNACCGDGASRSRYLGALVWNDPRFGFV